MTAIFTKRFAAKLMCCIILYESSSAQVKARTEEGTFAPPVLDLKVSFNGLSVGNTLEAGEAAQIIVHIANSGQGNAQNVEATLKTEGSVPGVAFDSTTRVGDVPSHGQARTAMHIAALGSVRSQTVRMTLEVHDRFRHSVVRSPVEFSTREALPWLRIQGEWIRLKDDPLPSAVTGGTNVRRGDTATILVKCQNVGRGNADSLQAHIMLQDVGRHATFKGEPLPSVINGLPPDSVATFSCPLVVDERFSANLIGISIRIQERRPTLFVEESTELHIGTSTPGFEESVMEYLRRGAYDSAITVCKMALANRPRDPLPYFCLGKAYYQKKDSNKCLGAFQEAARLGHEGAHQWLAENTVSRNETTVSRNKIVGNLLASAQYPVGLGVLKFSTSRGTHSALTQIVVDSLKSRPRVLEKFTLYPYSSLDEQRTSLGIESLDPHDLKALAKLEKLMDIKFVVYGVAMNEDFSRFDLNVVRTSDGKTVFSQQFRKSRNSTPINDAVMVFESFMRPVYRNHEIVEFRH
jgi:hypothetical protein